MPVDLFLQDHRLLSVPEEALPGILALAFGMELAVHWDSMQTTLYVDSPLRDRRILCMAEAAEAFADLGRCIQADLIRRIQAAGGLTTAAARRQTAATIQLRVDPSPGSPDSRFALEVHHSLSPGCRRLGHSIAAHLRSATGWPVSVARRGILWGRRINVHFTLPATGGQRDVCQQVAEGIWRGLMAHYSRRRVRGPAVSGPQAAAPPEVILPAPVSFNVSPQLRPQVPPLAMRTPVVGGTTIGKHVPFRPVAYRPLRPGLGNSTPVYTWTWTIGASEWEVVRPTPPPGEHAAALDTLPAPPDARDECPVSDEQPGAEGGIEPYPVTVTQLGPEAPTGNFAALLDDSRPDRAELDAVGEPTE